MGYLVKPGTTAEDIAEQREYAARLLANASSTKPVSHWTQILAQMAQGGLGGYEAYEAGQEGRRRESEASGLFDSAIGALAGTGGAAAGAASGGAAASPLPVSPASSAAAAAGREVAPAARGGFADMIHSIESGGRADARNPRSSATGPGQFIDSTWLSVTRGEPEAEGKTPAQILAMRTDGSPTGMAFSARMTDKYATANQRELAASGLPTTPGTTYLAHFLGPAGARTILSTRDNVPATQVLPANVIQANPFLSGMTAGDIKQWADGKAARHSRVTGGASGAADDGRAQRLQTASALYRNPTTRPLAQQIVASELSRERKTPQVVSIDLGNGQKRSMMQMPDGSLRPIDPALMGGGANGQLPPNFDDTQKLRKELTAQPGVQKFTNAIGSYESMMRSAAIDTPAAELDLIYGTAKILDPESVVRESEGETIRKTQNIPDWLMGYYQYLTSGKGKLPPGAREQLMGVAYRRVDSYRSQAEKEAERFKRVAERFGMDPSLVATEFSAVQEWKAPDVAPGAPGAGGGASGPVIRWEDGPDGKPRRVQ